MPKKSFYAAPLGRKTPVEPQEEEGSVIKPKWRKPLTVLVLNGLIMAFLSHRNRALFETVGNEIIRQSQERTLSFIAVNKTAHQRQHDREHHTNVTATGSGVAALQNETEQVLNIATQTKKDKNTSIHEPATKKTKNQTVSPQEFDMRCGCPETCNFWSLRDRPGHFNSLCEERIEFFQKRYRTARRDACKASATQGWCSMSCHPEVCAPVTPIEEQYPMPPTNSNKKKKTISYQFRKGNHYNTNSYDKHDCSQRPPLPETLSQEGQFNFSTFITTNLSIAVMGDSVGAYQIGQNFIEAAGGLSPGQQRAVLVKGLPYPNNQVTAATSQGGGVVAYYRANGGMLSHALLRNGPVGVSANHVHQLKNFLYQKTTSHHVDVMVLFIPVGWMGREGEIVAQVTTDALAESVRVAGEIFGARTVVLATVPVNNNLVLIADHLIPMNQRIKSFVQQYRTLESDQRKEIYEGVEDVLLLDFGSFSVDLAMANAISMELVTQQSHDNNHAVAVQALQEALQRKVVAPIIDRPVPLFCSQSAAHQSTECVMNGIWYDGMHLCTANVGGRINAGIACLLSCIYSDDPVSTSSTSIVECESTCNNKFMSIEPINL